MRVQSAARGRRSTGLAHGLDQFPLKDLFQDSLGVCCRAVAQPANSLVGEVKRIAHPIQIWIRQGINDLSFLFR
jgi:hypothetical protein